MSTILMAARRLAQTATPRLTRGIQGGGVARSAEQKTGELTHKEVVYGDGHHGIRAGWQYDWEHGPHYLDLSKVPNWKIKYKAFVYGVYFCGLGIPTFAVWYQQSKLKTG